MRWNKQMGLALVLLGVLVLLATGNAYIRKGMQKEEKCEVTVKPESQSVLAPVEVFQTTENFQTARAKVRSEMLSGLLQSLEQTQDEAFVNHAREEISGIQRDMEAEFAMERMMIAQGWEGARVFCWQGSVFVECGEPIGQEDAEWILQLAAEIGNAPEEKVFLHGGFLSAE